MQQQAASTGRYAGRGGLEILRRMTRNLKVHGRGGNRVEIVYDWWFPPDAAIISGA